jgi:sulfur carrier protein
MVAASFHEGLHDSSVTSPPGGPTVPVPALGRGSVTGDNSGMDIRLNGECLALQAPCTITALLSAQGLAERRVAVEVNGEIVPRGRHAEHVLAKGDVVEIVHALGGG